MLKLDADTIEARLRTRLTRFEFGALVALLLIQLGFVYLRASYGEDVAGIDLMAFYDAAHGDYWGFFYADWILPVFMAMDALPGELGYLVWGTANIGAVFFATRVFGGNVPILLFSYQMLYTAFFGQITGLTCGGLALLWWGMARGWWQIAGFGLLLAATKFQIGATYGLALWLLADVRWRDRWQVLIIPLAVGILSLVWHPTWPFDLLERLQDNPPDSRGNISLWVWIGPLALVLWLPVLALKLTPGQRLVGVGAAAALALPYFQQNDLLHLFMLPVGWLGLLGNWGYAFGVLGDAAFQVLALVPLVAYGWVLGQHFAQTRPAQPATST